LKSQNNESSPFVKKGDELSLSNQALLQLAGAVLNRERPFRFEAKGYSMSPFIRDRDILTVSPTQLKNIKLGDVVAFRHTGSGRMAIHRIIGKQTDSLTIKGDNALSSDGAVPTENILGRITKIERDGKPIRLGLGPERVIIALLSRAGLLPILLYPIRKIRFAGSQVHKFTSSVRRLKVPGSNM
jgi:signal peptidase